MVIALRRRCAASNHDGGEGHAEHINYKVVVNIGTGRFGCMYIEKGSVESCCWYMNVLYPNRWTVVKDRGS